MEFICSLYCDRSESFGGCGDCHSCKLIEAGNLPDLHLVDCRDSDRWNVEGVRKLLNSLRLQAFGGKARVVLLDNAEGLSITSANILLKSLEEPGKNTYFILVTSNPSVLPLTILSRCQPWYFDRLSHDQVKNILGDNPGIISSNALEDFEVDELALLADGSLSVLSYLGGRIEIWKEISDSLIKISNGDTEEVVRLSMELKRNKGEVRAAFTMMRIVARREMQSAAKSAEQARWSTFLMNVIDMERILTTRNLNLQLLVQNVLMELSPIPNTDSVLYPGGKLLREMIV